MSKFVTKRITDVVGRQIFKQLIILSEDADVAIIQRQIDENERLGVEVQIQGQLDLYEAELEDRYHASFQRILGNMNRIANLEIVPPDKFKDVSTSKSLATEFEYKYGDLRAWAIKIKNGQLFILGGYKNQQKPGFNRFRSLVEQYLKQ